MSYPRKKTLQPDQIESLHSHARTVLNALLAHEASQSFLDSHNHDERYYEIITEDITLNDIQKRVNALKYRDFDRFVEDVRLVFENASAYYSEDTLEYLQATTMLELLDSTLNQLPPLDLTPQTPANQAESTPEPHVPGHADDMVIDDQQPEQQEEVKAVELTERQEWARLMRLKFTNKEMITDDGMINKDFFKPKDLKVNLKKWGPQEKENLLKGILKHGVGDWGKIREEFLQAWADNDLRLKTARLIGRQNLSSYRGWKPTEAEINAEFQKNKDIGVKLGAWKGGVLVADDDGKVEAALREASA